MTDPRAQAPKLHPSATPRCWALIPCAGTGARSGASGPKQYQAVAGRPMVWHTMDAFAKVPRLAGTVLVVSSGDSFMAHQELPNATFSVVSCGGSTRAASVFNGLNWLRCEGVPAHDWVLVHDAARCLITPQLINQLIDACLSDEVGGLLALPLPDTLKSAHAGRVASTLSRSDKWLAQTPQMFRIGSLMDALQLAGDAVTDESSAIEAMGLAPKLVPGSAQNFKVTYPEDFALAQAVLHSRMDPHNPLTNA